MDIADQIDMALEANVSLPGGDKDNEAADLLSSFAKEVAAPPLGCKDGHMTTGSFVLFCVSFNLC